MIIISPKFTFEIVELLEKMTAPDADTEKMRVYIISECIALLEEDGWAANEKKP